MLDNLKNSKLVNEILNSIELVEFEDLFLTGGTLRNIVWNKLHCYNENSFLEDCDIIFYNPFNLTKEYEKIIEQILFSIQPNLKWSVKNQARMHLRNGHQPYNDIITALRAFPETCSAIAIGRNFKTLAPFGFIDLLNFRVNPTNFCFENEPHIFINRTKEKGWNEKWPNLIINEKILLTTMAISNC